MDNYFFNKQELSQLFKSPPVYSDDEIECHDYRCTDEHGFILAVSISVFDEYVIVLIGNKKFTKPIFNRMFKNVDKICTDSEKLILHLQDNRKANVFFKPNFAITLE